MPLRELPELLSDYNNSIDNKKFGEPTKTKMSKKHEVALELLTLIDENPNNTIPNDIIMALKKIEEEIVSLIENRPWEIPKENNQVLHELGVSKTIDKYKNRVSLLEKVSSQRKKESVVSVWDHRTNAYNKEKAHLLLEYVEHIEKYPNEKNKIDDEVSYFKENAYRVEKYKNDIEYLKEFNIFKENKKFPSNVYSYLDRVLDEQYNLRVDPTKLDTIYSFIKIYDVVQKYPKLSTISNMAEIKKNLDLVKQSNKLLKKLRLTEISKPMPGREYLLSDDIKAQKNFINELKKIIS
ncbi:MAG: hypothetical protein HRT87_08200 [Legionellales bacterium]|nr:hypothetical protein [Legionellales bacterium]